MSQHTETDQWFTVTITTVWTTAVASHPCQDQNHYEEKPRERSQFFRLKTRCPSLPWVWSTVQDNYHYLRYAHYPIILSFYYKHRQFIQYFWIAFSSTEKLTGACTRKSWIAGNFSVRYMFILNKGKKDELKPTFRIFLKKSQFKNIPTQRCFYQQPTLNLNLYIKKKIKKKTVLWEVAGLVTVADPGSWSK